MLTIFFPSFQECGYGLHYWLLQILLLAVTRGSSAACPVRCRCSSSVVLCDQGGFSFLPPALDKRIEVLELSGTWDSPNNIQTIDVRFSLFPKLLELSVTHSRVKVIQDKVLSYLPALEKLNLSRNQISGIDENTFHGLTQLRVLDLHSNNIGILHRDYLVLSSLQYLDLRNNKLSNLPDGIFSWVHNLRTLYLSGNNLEEFGNILLNLYYLEELRLDNCKIQSMLTSTFSSTPNLISVNLENNYIIGLSQTAFHRLTKLRNISLAGNKIERLSNTNFNGLKLHTLNLSANKIAYIPIGAFDYLEVSSLDLSYNEIAHLFEGTFDHSISSLKYLDLSDNPIQNLQKRIYWKLKNLETLKLSKIGLRELDVGFLNGLESLKHLDLTRNYLENIPEIVARKFSQLHSIDLSHNPWVCNCYIQPLRKVLLLLINYRPESAHLNGCSREFSQTQCPTCHWPEKLKSIPLVKLEVIHIKSCASPHSNMSSDDSTITIIAIVVPVVILIVIGLIVFLILWHRRRKLIQSDRPSTAGSVIANPALSTISDTVDEKAQQKKYEDKVIGGKVISNPALGAEVPHSPGGSGSGGEYFYETHIGAEVISNPANKKRKNSDEEPSPFQRKGSKVKFIIPSKDCKKTLAKQLNAKHSSNHNSAEGSQSGEEKLQGETPLADSVNGDPVPNHQMRPKKSILKVSTSPTEPLPQSVFDSWPRRGHKPSANHVGQNGGLGIKRANGHNNSSPTKSVKNPAVSYSADDSIELHEEQDPKRRRRRNRRNKQQTENSNPLDSPVEVHVSPVLPVKDSVSHPPYEEVLRKVRENYQNDRNAMVIPNKMQESAPAVVENGGTETTV